MIDPSQLIMIGILLKQMDRVPSHKIYTSEVEQFYFFQIQQKLYVCGKIIWKVIKISHIFTLLILQLKYFFNTCNSLTELEFRVEL